MAIFADKVHLASPRQPLNRERRPIADSTTPPIRFIPEASFFFHPWTWSTDTHPGHTFDALHQLPMQLIDDIEWGRAVMKERSKLTDEDIGTFELFDKARVEDTEFALRYGLVHEVVERKIPPGIMTWNIA